MSEENLSEYTVNDFSAVDDQISEIAKRERARTFAYRLESARYLVGYTALAIFLVGLLSIVLAWAYRLVTEPHQTETIKVVKPEIIEKEVIRYVTKDKEFDDSGCALTNDGLQLVSRYIRASFDAEN